ncbi:MAG: YHYH protein [Planctomycetota bacterium]
MSKRNTLLAILALTVAGTVTAQRMGRPMRRHTATETRPLRLVPATQRAAASDAPEISEADGYRYVRSSGVPEHKVGRFPNRGNPNPIRPQRYTYRMPLSPVEASRVTPANRAAFGVAINGTPFDPGAAEFWQGDPRSGWVYEALGGAVALGLDANHAHVQPTGAYHYHGLPTGLLAKLGVAVADPSAGAHSPIVGWAADGFPIYALYGYSDPESSDSQVTEMRASWRLKSGERPGGARAPSGPHDGAFIADYEYVAGLGDLDECNGRRCVTPDFPDGVYAYFLTRDWPVIPRQWRGRPDRSFFKGPPPRR